MRTTKLPVGFILLLVIAAAAFTVPARAADRPARQIAAPRSAENAYLDQYFQQRRVSAEQTRNPLFDLAGTDPAEFARIVSEDLERVKFDAARADSLINYLENLDNLFRRAADETMYITVTERRRLQKEWAAFFRSIDRLHGQAERYERDFLDMIANRKDDYFEGYMLGTVAHAATFIYGARFLHLTGGSAKFEAILNSSSPEENLPGGSFDLFKKRLVGRFAMARIMYFQKHMQGYMKGFYKQSRPALIDQDQWMLRFWNGHAPIVRAAIEAVRADQSWFETVISNPVFAALFKVYYPVLKTVSNFLGDTKVRRTDYYLITDEQIAQIVANLEPGDIFFERRNWYLSNVFIPGFWPHAGIFIGTFEEAGEYFDRADVRSYFKLLGYDGFTDYVQQVFPEALASWNAPNHYDHQPNRIIESIRDGVVFSSATEAYAADFVGAVRPRLPRVEKAKAVIHALTFWGSEYDYDFNFRNDDSVFCTEFVAKAYAEDSDKRGVTFPLEEIPFGKKVVQANGMARTYAEQADTPEAQMDFVYFMKGLEDEDRAVVSTEAEFRLTPDWKGLLEAGPERRLRRLQRTGNVPVPAPGK